MPSNNKDTFLKSLPAGFIIGVCSAVFLTVQNIYIAAFLFSLGLFTILSLDLYLYTGKVGFLLQHKSVLKVIITWFGNFVGAAVAALLVSKTRMIDNQHMVDTLDVFITLKTTDSIQSLFILGILCGLMMYLAAFCFSKAKDTNNSFGGYLGMVLCVMMFLLGGFEHSVANMFYFNLNADWSTATAVSLIVVTLGNAVGGLLFPFVLQFTKS